MVCAWDFLALSSRRVRTGRFWSVPRWRAWVLISLAAQASPFVEELVFGLVRALGITLGLPDSSAGTSV